MVALPSPNLPLTRSRKVEYLLTRVHKAHSNVQFSEHALEHVLSYQRRVHAIKQDFLQRRKMTPLGITAQWWDQALQYAVSEYGTGTDYIVTALAKHFILSPPLKRAHTGLRAESRVRHQPALGPVTHSHGAVVGPRTATCYQ